MFKTQIAATEVISTLKKHMLIDGYNTVLDLKKSHNAWFVDAATGTEYVDFFNGVSSMPLGFNHPKLTSPEVIERLGRIAINKPANADAYTTEMASFVETFFRVAVPDYLTRVFFVEGGALAVENALKTAMDWKVQKNLTRGYTADRYPDGYGTKVLHFSECFHGRSGYTLSMTDSPDPNKTKWFPKFDWPRIPTAKASFPLEGPNLAKTIEREKAAVAAIESALREYENEICCLILEPIQGEGGDNHFRTEFMQELRRLADEHEFLLVFDEVQTGLGLTGKMWGHQHHNVNPDILAFGKKTQVCGILVGPRLDEVEDHVFRVSSRLNSTWGGNLIDMARCQLFLEVYEEENLLDHVTTLGGHLKDELDKLSDEFAGQIENVRGEGLLCAFDLAPEVDRTEVIAAARRNRVIILPTGRHGLRFRPALTIDRETLDEGLTRLRSALRETIGAATPA